MVKPPCADWGIWLGPEVEGTSEIGEQTLFIRKLSCTAEEFRAQQSDLVPSLTRRGVVRRVWFCKEFTSWPLIRLIAPHFKTVCLEVSAKGYDNLPRDFRTSYTIYLKLPFMLKKGDHVCVGADYQDEAFCIGTGAIVSPESYLNDKKVQ